MAGNERIPPAAAPTAPSVRALQCPQCGGALQVRGLGQTSTIVCASCASIVDISSDDLRILTTAANNVTRTPLIPLGTRGKLRGDPYEVIGFVCRQIVVEDQTYEWREYLLFNPYKGFRWLTEYDGHWNDVKTTNGRPEESGKMAVAYLGTTFKHFQTATATVAYVLGEFYWQVRVGETAEVSDYVSPPLMLSKEQTADDVTWSLGEYMEPDAVWQAFALPGRPPERSGVYANQPSPFAGKTTRVWRAFAGLAAAAVILQSASCLLAQNKLVFQQHYTFSKLDAAKVEVTEPFELGGHTSNVAVQTTAGVENSWIYLNLALISLDDGRAWDFGREVSYYHGVDGGESWSEGSGSDEAVLPAVPPGQYYLRIEPESDAASIPYTIEVRRDVPQYWFLLLALVALAGYPLLVWMRSRTFETSRWSESDDAPAGKSSGDADDS